MNTVNFEKLLDGTRVITVKVTNHLGETILRQEVIKSQCVFDVLKEEIESKTKDLSEFAEWCATSWEYDYHTEIWENYHTKETKTTSQLREMWKKEKEEQK